MDKQKAAQLAGLLFSDMISAMEHDKLTWEEAIFAAGLAAKGMAMHAIEHHGVTAVESKAAALDALSQALTANVATREVQDGSEIGATVHTPPVGGGEVH